MWYRGSRGSREGLIPGDLTAEVLIGLALKTPAGHKSRHLGWGGALGSVEFSVLRGSGKRYLGGGVPHSGCLG